MDRLQIKAFKAEICKNLQKLKAGTETVEMDGLRKTTKNKSSTLVIGIAGGIGSGKTVAAQILEAKGAYIIDTDEVSRRVSAPDTECCRQLSAAFPQCVVDGVLQRPLLKKLVFSDENSRKTLNFITHKYILEVVKKEIEGKKWAVVQVPLLFESGFDGFCNITLGILADEKIRTERVLKRDRMTAELVAAIIKTQLSDQELKKKCDFCIENNEGHERLKEGVDDFYQKIKKRIDASGAVGGRD